MNRSVIALIGFRGSGKTTIFESIKNRYPEALEIHMLQPIKYICGKTFQLNMEKLNTYSKELENPIELTRSNIEKCIQYFSLEFNYDKHVRPHVGNVLYTKKELLDYIDNEILKDIDSFIRLKKVARDISNEKMPVITDIRTLEEFNYFKDKFKNEFFPFFVENIEAKSKTPLDSYFSRNDYNFFKNNCDNINNNYSLHELKSAVLSKLGKIIKE